MPATLNRVAAGIVLLGLVAVRAAAGQGSGPLRKTDLVRLLTGGTLAQDEIAALVRRSCLSFRPTGRDRADLAALGAGSAVLRAVDVCALPPRPTPPPPPPVAPVPRPVPVSPARTGFVTGTGQRGAVETRPVVPILFEVRDTSGAPVPGQAVFLTTANGHLGASRAVTDSAGRVHVDLTFGPKVGPTLVTATVGTIERQAALFATPGPAAELLFRCGTTEVEGRVILAGDAPVVLRVGVRDALGNDVPVRNLQAAAADKSVLRVTAVATDGAGGLVSLRAGDAGTTSLVVVASGRREDLVAVVRPPRGAAGARCSD